MTHTPRVTVIMAVHNEARFIVEAVDSVLAQSFTDFELIISDDGSTDETPAIARSLAQRDPVRLRVLRSEQNQGKPFALNRALGIRNGEYVAWLDGDDVMHPDKLRRQVAVLDAEPGAAGCCHDAEMFDAFSGHVIGLFSRVANGSRLRSGGVEMWFDPTYRMLPSATMIRASLLPPGGFDERLTYTNDWLFDIEVFRQGPCIAIDDALVRYRRHDENLSTRGETSGVTYEEALMAMAIVTARYPSLQRRARTVVAALILGQARRAIASRDWPRAAQQASAAYGIGGVLGLLGVARAVARSATRRRRVRAG
ncbi:MAG: glycosyl transferase, family 2 [Solirubrobacterales bacterium]|nr:glycosyl transferase, family 2 [Solirubrobacterales bacterium]